MGTDFIFIKSSFLSWLITPTDLTEMQRLLRNLSTFWKKMYAQMTTKTVAFWLGLSSNSTNIRNKCSTFSVLAKLTKNPRTCLYINARELTPICLTYELSHCCWSSWINCRKNLFAVSNLNWLQGFNSSKQLWKMSFNYVKIKPLTTEEEFL